MNWFKRLGARTHRKTSNRFYVSRSTNGWAVRDKLSTKPLYDLEHKSDAQRMCRELNAFEERVGFE